MERSAGVTVSAVAAIAGSTLLLFIGVIQMFVLAAASQFRPNGTAAIGPIFLASGLFMLAFSVWGYTTAVGLFRLQAWSRISMLVFSGLLTLACASSAGMMLFDRSGLMLQPIAIRVMIFEAALAFFGGAWLYFFAKRGTRAQFRAASAAADRLTRPLLITCVVLTSVLLVAGSVRFSSGVKAIRAEGWHKGPQAQALIGRPAPDFQLHDLYGNRVHLADLKGKVLVLDFWATWCGPCREEMPKLERLSREFANRNVIVAGINVDEPEETVRKFIRKNKYSYPVLLAGRRSSVAAAYKVSGFPSLVTVDSHGIIQDFRVGASDKSESELRAGIKDMLEPGYVSKVPVPSEVRSSSENTAALAKSR